MTSRFTAKTGRVRRYESDVANEVPINQRLLPVSCTIFLYDNESNGLHELLWFCSKSLRYGSGVKVHFGNKAVSSGEPIAVPQWHFMLDPNHTDFDKINQLPDEIKECYIFQDELEEKYLNNPDARYRIIKVADTMQNSERRGMDSIEESWYSFEVALLLGYTPIVDLSALRPAGTPSGAKTAAKQLIATGALGIGDDPKNPESGSFVSIYYRIFNFLRTGDIIALMQLLGQLNRTLLQGREKTGIICTGIDYDSPHVKRYLRFPLAQLLGSQKKAIRINAEVLSNPALIKLICEKVNTESLFLEKIRPDGYSNVCGEIIMKPEGTCNLQHVNAGLIENPSQIPTAMAEVCAELIEYWLTWRDNVSPVVSNIYLALENDRQIGLGWIGWANFLANQRVSYYEFAHTFEEFLNKIENGSHNFPAPKNKAEEICINLYVGYMRCATLVHSYGIERAFTIAPTQSLFATTKDINGNTCSRGILAPFTLRVRRSSASKGSQFIFHGKEVETASKVGSEVHELLHDQWQRLMDMTGKAHTITYDLWHLIDEEWLKHFVTEMHLITTYYNFSGELHPDYLNKGKVQTVNVATANAMPCDCAQ